MFSVWNKLPTGTLLHRNCPTLIHNLIYYLFIFTGNERCSGLTVGMLDAGLRGLGSRPGRSHCVLFILGTTA